MVVDVDKKVQMVRKMSWTCTQLSDINLRQSTYTLHTYDTTVSWWNA